jgi:NADPH-dependent curcumin reductase CurA
MNDVNRRIVLASRPEGEPTPENFRLETVPVPTIGPGQVLLRTHWLSLDPYMRGRMSAAKSYAKPVEIGDVMEAGTVSEIVASENPGFSVGDIVLSHSGWQVYAISDGKGMRKLDSEAAPVTTALGILGMPGMTAYTGLLNIGQPKAGETLVVAAAAGPVGSLVGQIARLKGCRAVGIAGGPEKCSYVREDLGFDAVIDHRASDFAAQLEAACLQGVDNDFARVPVCGLVSQYNATSLPQGPDRTPMLMRAILSKRLTLRGFIVRDFAAQSSDFARDVGAWLRAGQIRYKEDVTDGLERAPEAFIGMLKGRNFGKTLVRI